MSNNSNVPMITDPEDFIRLIQEAQAKAPKGTLVYVSAGIGEA